MHLSAPRWHFPMLIGCAVLAGLTALWGDPAGRLLAAVVVTGCLVAAWAQRPGPLVAVSSDGAVCLRGLLTRHCFMWNARSRVRLVPSRSGTRSVAVELDPDEDSVLPGSISLWRLDCSVDEVIAALTTCA